MGRVCTAEPGGPLGPESAVLTRSQDSAGRRLSRHGASSDAPLLGAFDSKPATELYVGSNGLFS